MLNMWYDADIDAVMTRTAMRPIPRGKISRSEALVFGLVLGGFAVVVLALATNLTAAALLACTILFYIVVYTAWLKRRDATEHRHRRRCRSATARDRMGRSNRRHRLEPLALFLIIFLWTPPHFWALALNRTGDYARAGVPMLPVVAGQGCNNAADPDLQRPPGSRLGAALGTRVCRCDLWRDRRDLRGAFPAARIPAEQEHWGRSPHSSQAVRVLHLLFVVLFAALLVDHGGDLFSPMHRPILTAPRRCMPNSSQALSAAHAAPSTSARSNMRYGLLAAS